MEILSFRVVGRSRVDLRELLDELDNVELLSLLENTLFTACI